MAIQPLAKRVTKIFLALSRKYNYRISGLSKPKGVNLFDSLAVTWLSGWQVTA